MIAGNHPTVTANVPTGCDHSLKHDAYYAVFGPWWNAAKDGKALPVK